MIYRVYIYRSTCTSASTHEIGICNRAISTNSLYQWKDNEAAEYMQEFDVHFIIGKIQSFLGTDCGIQIRTRDGGADEKLDKAEAARRK